jgi:hypothetical protein
MSGMSGMQTLPGTGGTCPFCGVATPVPHETQAACIAALHTEIDRMRGILATLRPTGVNGPIEDPGNSAPATVRLALD